MVFLVVIISVSLLGFLVAVVTFLAFLVYLLEGKVLLPSTRSGWFRCRRWPTFIFLKRVIFLVRNHLGVHAINAILRRWWRHCWRGSTLVLLSTSSLLVLFVQTWSVTAILFTLGRISWSSAGSGCACFTNHHRSRLQSSRCCDSCTGRSQCCSYGRGERRSQRFQFIGRFRFRTNRSR